MISVSTYAVVKRKDDFLGVWITTGIFKTNISSKTVDSPCGFSLLHGARGLLKTGRECDWSMESQSEGSVWKTPVSGPVHRTGSKCKNHLHFPISCFEQDDKKRK